jgi:hypothetical protein
MRRLTGTMLGAAVAMASFAAQAAGAFEEDACEVLESEVAELDSVLLAELFDEVFDEGPCAPLRGAAEARLEAMVSTPSWRDLEQPEPLAGLALMLAEQRLQRALSAGDAPAAREAMAVVRQRQGWMIELEEADSELDQESYMAEWQREEAKRLSRIEAILEGEPVVFEGDRIAAPEPDWTLYHGWCGTPAMMFHQRARNTAGAPQALLARGEPELALQALLREQWVDGISLGMAPPLLRELAERAFGEGAYEHEVARALAGIELRDTPLGWQAQMPMFGLSLPLPVAVKSWQDEDSKRFTQREDLVAWVEQLLLPAIDEPERESLAAEGSEAL